MRLLAVNHHYYRTEEPASGIYPITPARFAGRIATLSARWHIVDEGEFVETLESGDAQPRCLLTFDDGLKEQVAAARWLSAEGLAAVFYIPTLPVLEKRVLDVHKLHMIRAARPDESLVPALTNRFGSRLSQIDVDAARRQYRYDGDDAARIKYLLNFVLTSDERAFWIDSMFAEIHGDEGAAAEALYMDRDEVCALAHRGMIGAHGHAHVALAGEADEAIRADLSNCIDGLKSICGCRVRGLSYPYGGPSAVDERVARIAAEYGFSYGLTMNRGVNETVRDRLLLRRIDTNDAEAYAGATAA